MPTLREWPSNCKASGMRRLADLKGSLAMIAKLIQFETGIMGNVVTLENAPASQPSLADKNSKLNAMFRGVPVRYSL